MNTATTNRPMNYNFPSGTVLLASYLLNIATFLGNFSPAIKIILLGFTALTTVMAFFNQYKTFQKNFKTLWIVVSVTHVFTFLKPRKNRHRGIVIKKQSKIKKTTDDTPVS